MKMAIFIMRELVNLFLSQKCTYMVMWKCAAKGDEEGKAMLI